jgi:hypothetical protein
MERTCNKCGEIKSIKEFSKVKIHGIIYTRSVCDSCMKMQKKIYRGNNKDKISIGNKIYKDKHKEEIAIKKKVYMNLVHTKNPNYEKNRYNKRMKYNSLYREKNKDRLQLQAILRARAYRKKNIIKIKIKRSNDIKNLSNEYMLGLIKDKTGLERKIIKQYPDLIETYRTILKLKRLTKNYENEKCNRSKKRLA